MKVSQSMHLPETTGTTDGLGARVGFREEERRSGGKRRARPSLPEFVDLSAMLFLA